MSPDQERRASFLREREEYASSLERIITQARERSASCSPSQPTRSMAIVPVNSSCISTSRSITLTTKGDRSSPISSVFEDSENEIPVANDSNQLSKRPISSRGEGVRAKRVALGVLDSNTRRSIRRSPRSEKGKNSYYSHKEYTL